MKSIHVHTTNTITSLSPPGACSFSAASHLLCFVGWSLPPCRSACGRKCTDHSGPENKQGAWTWAISPRCSSTKIGGNRSESAAGGMSGKILGLGIWAENRWTWADWSGGQWSWTGRRWWSQEPTALSHQNVASSSWEEDKDPANLSVDLVHQVTTLIPLEFSAPAAHHHDLGQAGYGTHVVKKTKGPFYDK